jgi:hypothetical protein
MAQRAIASASPLLRTKPNNPTDGYATVGGIVDGITIRGDPVRGRNASDRSAGLLTSGSGEIAPTLTLRAFPPAVARDERTVASGGFHPRLQRRPYVAVSHRLPSCTPRGATERSIPYRIPGGSIAESAPGRQAPAVLTPAGASAHASRRAGGGRVRGRRVCARGAGRRSAGTIPWRSGGCPLRICDRSWRPSRRRRAVS